MVLCFKVSGQSNEEATKPAPIPYCSKAYFDISTGINNNGGLLGLGIDVHAASKVSVNGGVGLVSSWGYKLYLGAKYYLKPCHKGWAVGGGLTFSTGLPKVWRRMETAKNTVEEVGLKLLPQSNFFAAFYRSWRIGRNKNRMYLQLGLTHGLDNRKFEQLSGPQISTNSAERLKRRSPGGAGGIIVGIGFSIGAR
jgi:hypothetical protein